MNGVWPGKVSWLLLAVLIGYMFLLLIKVLFIDFVKYMEKPLHFLIVLVILAVITIIKGLIREHKHYN